MVRNDVRVCEAIFVIDKNRSTISIWCDGCFGRRWKEQTIN